MVYKATILLYLACAGRKGELSNVQWEDLSQITYEGKLCWKIKYVQEKQQGRPDTAEAILGDEISNMAFQLYVSKWYNSIVVHLFLETIILYCRLFS